MFFSVVIDNKEGIGGFKNIVVLCCVCLSVFFGRYFLYVGCYFGV